MGVCCSSTANSPIYKSIQELELPTPIEAYYENHQFTNSSMSSDTTQIISSAQDTESATCEIFPLLGQEFYPNFEGLYSEIVATQMRATRSSNSNRPNSFTCNFQDWSAGHMTGDKVKFSPSAHGVIFHLASPPAKLKRDHLVTKLDCSSNIGIQLRQQEIESSELEESYSADDECNNGGTSSNNEESTRVLLTRSETNPFINLQVGAAVAAAAKFSPKSPHRTTMMGLSAIKRRHSSNSTYAKTTWQCNRMLR